MSQAHRTAVACLAVAASAALAASPALAGNFSYIAKGTQCLARGSDEQPEVAARTTFKMFGDQSGLGFYSYILKARLVPTTAGLNFVRPWRQTKVNALLNGASTATLSVTTGWNDGLKAWKLQVRLEWDRPGPKNYVRNLTVRFHGCTPLGASPPGLPARVQPLPGSTTGG